MLIITAKYVVKQFGLVMINRRHSQGGNARGSRDLNLLRYTLKQVCFALQTQG